MVPSLRSEIKRLSVVICILLLRSAQTLQQVQGSRINVEVGKVSYPCAVQERKLVFMGGRIGSRPPSCHRRCLGCGRCEAVQVPVTTPLNKAIKETNRRRHHSSSSSSSWVVPATSKWGDDGGTASNYKPLSWKCKCGDMVFDP